MEKIGLRSVGLDEEGGYAFTLTKEEYQPICLTADNLRAS